MARTRRRSSWRSSTLFLLGSLLATCTDPCQEIGCVQPEFSFTVVDQNGNNVYEVANNFLIDSLEIVAPVDGEIMQVPFDITRTNRIYLPVFPTVIISYGNGILEDTLALTAVISKPDCCEVLQALDVQQNGAVLCTSCDEQEVVIVKR